MAEHSPTPIHQAPAIPAPARAPSTRRPAAEHLPDTLRTLAKRGHQLRVGDVASLIRAATLIETQRTLLDRHISVYGQIIGDLVETRHELQALREMLEAGLSQTEGML